MRQFATFLLVGVFNTAWGYLLIFGFMYLLTWSPEVSNIAGYAISLCTSYLLHRIYTFCSKNRKRKEIGRFLLIFAVAYGFNFIALSLLVRLFRLDPYLSQALAGAVYVGVSFLLNRVFVFRHAA